MQSRSDLGPLTAYGEKATKQTLHTGGISQRNTEKWCHGESVCTGSGCRPGWDGIISSLQSPCLLNKMVMATMHSKLGDVSPPFHDSCAKASASEKSLSQAWRCTPVIPELVRPKQEDCHEVKVSLSCKM